MGSDPQSILLYQERVERERVEKQLRAEGWLPQSEVDDLIRLALEMQVAKLDMERERFARLAQEHRREMQLELADGYEKWAAEVALHVKRLRGVMLHHVHAEYERRKEGK